MKYIRTKDGRILVADDNSLMAKLTTNKVADTIEELCDEFVMIDEENEHYIKQDNDIHHIRRKWAIGNYKVYGAIWTDEGLIYIAKMNDKGELELL